MSDIQTLRYIACVLLEDTHGINDYGWELIEKELLLEDITDVSRCVKSREERRYITKEDFIRLIVP